MGAWGRVGANWALCGETCGEENGSERVRKAVPWAWRASLDSVSPVMLRTGLSPWALAKDDRDPIAAWKTSSYREGKR